MTVERGLVFFFSVLFQISSTAAQRLPELGTKPSGQGSSATKEYLLGPEDQIKIWVLGLEELSEKPTRIDPTGNIDLPILGRIHAGGLTVEQLKLKLVERLQSEVWHPSVSIDIVEYGSQPVSILGAVTNPGVHQLRGRKNLVEVLSLAGGLRDNAGSTVKITRAIEWGPLPLASTKLDPSGTFSLAEVKTKDILSAKNPTDNILICPHDSITVPTAELISVIGEVRKPGSIVLDKRDTVSVLEALSMAEGLGPVPAPQNAKILRPSADGSQRIEVPVDLKQILAGKAADVSLYPNDILFVPVNGPKKAATRAIEAAIQTATGVIIWRRP